MNSNLCFGALILSTDLINFILLLKLARYHTITHVQRQVQLENKGWRS